MKLRARVCTFRRWGGLSSGVLRFGVALRARERERKPSRPARHHSQAPPPSLPQLMGGLTEMGVGGCCSVSKRSGRVATGTVC